MSQLADAVAAEVGLIPVIDRVPPSTLGYGTDLSCVFDVTPELSEVDPNTPRAIGEALARRLITPRGGVIDDLGYGCDLRGYCNRGVTQSELRSISSRVRSECRKDDRVTDAVATLTVVGPRMTVALAITPVDLQLGVFSLTFWVTADGIELQESIGQHG